MKSIEEEKNLNGKRILLRLDLNVPLDNGKIMGKISAWYDDEWGFSDRMCDIAVHVHKIS